MKRIINVSKELGSTIAYVQGRGGNSSIKKGTHMFVKASGVLLKHVSERDFIDCIYKDITEFFVVESPVKNKDNALLTIVDNAIIQGNSIGKPSLKTGLHAIIPSKYIIHTHSVYANVFNCMTNSEKYLGALLTNYAYEVIPYQNPGYYLAKYIYDLQLKYAPPSVLFLQNHGLVIHGNNLSKVVKLHKEINDILQNFIYDATGLSFDVRNEFQKMDKHFFPDSIVYSSVSKDDITEKNEKEFYEILSASTFIKNVVVALKETPVFISSDNVMYIQNMEREKHRMNLIRT